MTIWKFSLLVLAVSMDVLVTWRLYQSSAKRLAEFLDSAWRASLFQAMWRDGRKYHVFLPYILPPPSALPCRARQTKAAAKRTSEIGQVLVWTVIMLPLLLVLVGLVLDGGLMWAQFRRARWAADGAAVAAASEIDLDVWRERGAIVLSNNALDTAVWYAWQNDSQLHVTDVYVQNNIIYVKGWVQTQPTFLTLVPGVGPMQLHVTGHERPEWGVSSSGQ